MRQQFEAWLSGLNNDPLFWNASDAMFAAYCAGVLAERERCAKLCDDSANVNSALVHGRDS